MTKARNRCQSFDCWTEREDQILRNIYPDYVTIKRRLRRRTLGAIRRRAHYLSITTKRHIWTGHEASRLKKLYATTRRKELLSAFPGLSVRQIESRAWHFGVKKRRSLKPTGHPLADAIRARASELGWTMAKLDSVARTRRYFGGSQWQDSPTHTALLKALHVLGGELSVVWDD